MLNQKLASATEEKWEPKCHGNVRWIACIQQAISGVVKWFHCWEDAVCTCPLQDNGRIVIWWDTATSGHSPGVFLHAAT